MTNGKFYLKLQKQQEIIGYLITLIRLIERLQTEPKKRCRRGHRGLAT